MITQEWVMCPECQEQVPASDCEVTPSTMRFCRACMKHLCKDCWKAANKCPVCLEKVCLDCWDEDAKVCKRCNNDDVNKVWTFFMAMQRRAILAICERNKG